MRNSVPKQVSFTHTVLEGNPYDVGWQQGEELKADQQRAIYLTPVLPFLDAYSEREAQRALDYIEDICPGLKAEIQGAADSFGVPVAQIAFLGGKSKQTGASTIPVGEPAPGTPKHGGNPHCSQLVVLPSATSDGRLLAAQNTECGPADLDLRLVTTRVKGKPAHIGFSDMIFGRTGGINEYGLCVTSSWGAPMMWPPCQGLPYFAAIRALLERCRTVEEALQTLATIPVAWCTNIIVSDPSGEAALIEIAGEDRDTWRIGKGTREQFLCATNHFTSPKLHAYTARRRRESVHRRNTIVARIEAAAPQVTFETIQDLVSTPFPQGLCLHHYSSGMGTLWSTLFDVTAATVEVCLGAPSSEQNPWRTFGLQDPAGSTRYEAHLPDTPVSRGFWECLPPEAEG